MLSRGTLSHTGANGSSPGDRAILAGYPTSSVGENVGYDAGYGSYTADAIAHRMNDAWFTSSGHRANMLTANWTEFGGAFAVRQTHRGTQYATELFGRAAAGPFLTGVVFADRNADLDFDATEGLGGVTVTATGPAGTFTTTTLAAGGWSLEVPAGPYIVSATGGTYSGRGSVSITVGSQNMAVDFISGRPNGWVSFTEYVNAAPTLTTTTVSLPPVPTSMEKPAGALVSSLIGVAFSDPNPLASRGIAVTAATSGSAVGSWQYSIDAGGTWQPLGSVSEGTARLLRGQDLVRFVPSSGSAAGSASISYRAWDQTSGVAGSTASTTRNGGSSAFSTGIATATVATILTNTAPVLSSTGGASLDPIPEDSTSPAGTTVAAIVGTAMSDVDPGTPAGIAVTATTGGENGAWQYSPDDGASWVAVGTVSQASALLLRGGDKLRFVPVANFSGSATISYRAWDQSVGWSGMRPDLQAGGAVGGNSSISLGTATASVTITPVNDAPTAVAGRSAFRLKPVAANSSFNFTGTTIADLLGNAVADIDAGALTGIAVIGLGSGGSWYWNTGGSSWGSGGVSPQSATLLRSTDRLGFHPNSGFSGETTVTFRLWDRTTGSAGFNQANLSNPSVSTGGTKAFGTEVLTARIFVGSAGSAPTAAFGAVSRSPDGRTVASIPVTFSRSVEGLDPGDFTLTRGGVTVPLTAATLTGSGTSFVLGNLGDATALQGSYSLTLNAALSGIADSSGNRPAANSTTTFSVATEPLAPTDISLSATTIAENNAAGATVGTFSTTDADSTSFTYTLVSGSGDTGNASFTISSNQLRATASFDFETQSSYSIRVRSTDQSGLFTEKAFTITVTNLNEAPTYIALTAATLAENAGANAVVGTLSTTDPDAGNTFTYTLVTGTGSTDNAAFNISGNHLRATASLDFETKNSYSIRVRSTDQGGLTTDKVFTITVTDVLEVPSTPSAPTSVAAMAGNGQASLTWTAPSSDGGADITDYVVQYSSDGGSTWTTFIRTASAATSATVTGLTNGTAYVFRVAGVNSAGTGAFSLHSNAAVPLVADGLPTPRELRVMPGTISGELFAAWQMPAGSNTAAIMDFAVQASLDNGLTWHAVDDGISSEPSASLPGLNPAQSYVIRAAAVTAEGTGPWSAYSTAVSPRAGHSGASVEFVTVGNPGNANDPATGNLHGRVDESYRIGKYEFTNSQYAAFLNAIDPDGTNPNSVYNANMGSNARGGITNTGTTNGSRYAVKPNMGDKPINYVSWFDAARVANWLHHGAQTYASTDASANAPQNMGAYTLGTETGGTAPARNFDAPFHVPTENEWYKAAYYNPMLNSGSGGYRVYGNGFDDTPAIVSANAFGVGSAGGTGNFANYGAGVYWNGLGGNVTTVGTNGAAGYYGAFDMSGNVWEWYDLADAAGWGRGFRGSGWDKSASTLVSASKVTGDPSFESDSVGFRLASSVTPLSFISSSLFSSPTAVAATRDGTTATLTWQPPHAAASLQNLGYVVQQSNDGGQTWITASDSLSTSATSYQFTGLRADQQYVFRVAARSDAGVGAFSEAAAPVTVPSAPTSVAAMAGNGQASLTWTAPSSDSGADITDYVVQYSSDGGSTWTTFIRTASAATSATVTGLTNGTAYVFRVAGVNSAGTGTYSATSDQVTPVADTANRQPTAIMLDDLIQTLPETASTSSRTRVATLTLTDDDVGTNTFTLLGADAGFFEIVGDGLYLRGGVNLDYGTQSRYEVWVRVGDATADDWVSDTPLTGSYDAATGRLWLENTTDATLSLQSVTIVSPTGKLSGERAEIPESEFSTLNTDQFGLNGLHSEIFFANLGVPVLPLAPGQRWDLGAVAAAGMTPAELLAGFATDADADPFGESAAGQFLYSVIGQPAVRGTLTHRVEATFVLEITSVPEHSGREYVEVPVGQEVVDSTPRFGDRQVVVRGGGRTVLNAANTHSGGTRIEAGEVVIRHTAALGSGTLEVLPGARVTLDVDFSRVNVSNLVVHAGAVIDVGYGGLVLPAGTMSAADVRAMLISGRNGGSWNGHGISTGAAASGSRRGVGYRVLSNNSIVVAWAAFGDTNLDGRVNSTDINMILSANRFGTAATDGGWWQGDFNYDGRVNTSDINMLISAGLLNAPSYQLSAGGQSLQATSFASSGTMLMTAFGPIEQEQQPQPELQMVTAAVALITPEEFSEVVALPGLSASIAEDAAPVEHTSEIAASYAVSSDAIAIESQSTVVARVDEAPALGEASRDGDGGAGPIEIENAEPLFVIATETVLAEREGDGAGTGVMNTLVGLEKPLYRIDDSTVLAETTAAAWHSESEEPIAAAVAFISLREPAQETLVAQEAVILNSMTENSSVAPAVPGTIRPLLKLASPEVRGVAGGIAVRRDSPANAARLLAWAALGTSNEAVGGLEGMSELGTNGGRRQRLAAFRRTRGS